MSVKKTTGTRKTTTAKKTSKPRATKTTKQSSTNKVTVPAVEDSVREQSTEQVVNNALEAVTSEANIPAPATPVSPAVKESTPPVIKANTEVVVKEKAPVMLKEQAEVAIKDEAPIAIKESVEVPATKEKVQVLAAKEDKVSTNQEKKKFTPINLGANPYLPHVATVIEVIKETHNIMTFRVVIDDEEVMKNFTFYAGQVGQLSLFGAGESTFVINSPPFNKDYLQFSVMRTGEVTEALHKLSAGDKVGVRGPLGNCFPREEWAGKDIFFVGGGIGMAPIRTIMLDVLEHKTDYGKVSLLYGARSPNDMAFSYELESWMQNPDLDCHLTIDNPFEGWAHKVGLIPHILTDISPDPSKTVAVLCGPPIMIKFTVEALLKLNFAPENIITTLEKRMKCGIGICGRCNIGSQYVCVDGPVYSWAQLKELPDEL